MREKEKWLSIDRCKSHGFWAICINDAVGGTRLTNGKCCGSWDEVKRFPINDADIRNIISQLERYIDKDSTTYESESEMGQLQGAPPPEDSSTSRAYSLGLARAAEIAAAISKPTVAPWTPPFTFEVTF